MKKGIDWRYPGGAVLVLATVAAVFAVFFLLCTPVTVDRSLTETAVERLGWRYELFRSGDVRAWEPVFGEDGFVSLPEGTDAVRITRVMTEDIPGAELAWSNAQNGVEILLDGTVLYSDFYGSTRGDSGFLRPSTEDWARIERASVDTVRRVRLTLPADYRGRELSVVTYFSPNDADLSPEYTIIGSEDSSFADTVVFAVRKNIVTVCYAFLVFLLIGMFLLDLHNRDADGKMLLLCLYFLLLFLFSAANGYMGYYSSLERLVDISLLNTIYIVPLYLYITLCMKTRWKWLLFCAVSLWAAYECVCGVADRLRDAAPTAGSVGPGGPLVLLAVVVVFCVECLRQSRKTRQNKAVLRWYGAALFLVTAVCLTVKIHAWEGLGAYLINGIWTPIRMGNFGTVVELLTDIISYMAVIVVITDVIRRTVRTFRTMDVLQERERQAMDSYNRLLAAENATEALHHEMRHHMTALSGILKDGDVRRAAQYAETVAGELEQLPRGRYSRNMLVNVVAGSYLDRAAQGIRVEHRLAVPPELNIADRDLTVFLSNMLQNALEACERMEPDAERFIKIDMQIRGKFLFISCVNSAPDEPEQKEPRPGHGYGLAAMRRVAEKYNSVLVVKREPGRFTVMSDLCFNL